MQCLVLQCGTRRARVVVTLQQRAKHSPFLRDGPRSPTSPLVLVLPTYPDSAPKSVLHRYHSAIRASLGDAGGAVRQDLLAGGQILLEAPHELRERGLRDTKSSADSRLE